MFLDPLTYKRREAHLSVKKEKKKLARKRKSKKDERRDGLKMRSKSSISVKNGGQTILKEQKGPDYNGNSLPDFMVCARRSRLRIVVTRYRAKSQTFGGDFGF